MWLSFHFLLYSSLSLLLLFRALFFRRHELDFNPFTKIVYDHRFISRGSNNFLSRKINPGHSRKLSLRGPDLACVQFETGIFPGEVNKLGSSPRFVTGSAVAAADTISAPWTPASSGPPPDANGSGSDTKNLDVGEISDVSQPCRCQLRTTASALPCCALFYFN